MIVAAVAVLVVSLAVLLYVLYRGYRFLVRVLDDPDTERFLDGK